MRQDDRPLVLLKYFAQQLNIPHTHHYVRRQINTHVNIVMDVCATQVHFFYFVYDSIDAQGPA